MVPRRHLPPAQRLRLRVWVEPLQSDAIIDQLKNFEIGITATYEATSAVLAVARRSLTRAQRGSPKAITASVSSRPTPWFEATFGWLTGLGARIHTDLGTASATGEKWCASQPHSRRLRARIRTKDVLDAI